MRGSHKLEDLSKEQRTELTDSWKEFQQRKNPGEAVREPNEDDLENWVWRHPPCPAIKRNGEVCGSVRVSVSGHCFAHDPESAVWRAMGGRAKAKKVRARKKLKELGLGDMIHGLHEVFEELQASPPSATNARAMAKLADTVMKMTEWASEADKEPSFPAYPEWTRY